MSTAKKSHFVHFSRTIPKKGLLKIHENVRAGVEGQPVSSVLAPERRAVHRNWHKAAGFVLARRMRVSKPRKPGKLIRSAPARSRPSAPRQTYGCIHASMHPCIHASILSEFDATSLLTNSQFLRSTVHFVTGCVWKFIFDVRSRGRAIHERRHSTKLCGIISSFLLQ